MNKPTPTLSNDSWQEASPYLDHVLGMPEGEREPWLSCFRERNPALSTVFQALLDEHRILTAEHFLEEPPCWAARQAHSRRSISRPVYISFIDRARRDGQRVARPAQ
jgi:hypothetical protein